MSIESFLQIKEFDNIQKRLQSVQDELQSNSFNLFTVSSYNTYLENFHSDVIAILLDPEERHLQSDSFLTLFLDYLICSGAAINKEDYALCEITREKGRIDIWLKDNTSRKSIIIENKINNAADTENQLETYYNYALEAGFEIDSIVYLTLQGHKKAPLTDLPDLNAKILNLSAFTSSPEDLSNGWLTKCYEESQDENSRSFIFQYIKLIKHLSQQGLDRQIKEDFYKVINKDDGYQKTKAIAQLVAGLEEFRADLFSTRINIDYKPFKKMIRYRPNHILFENFNDAGIVFKLDVHFHTDARAQIDFWNPKQDEQTQRINTSEKLKAIVLYDEFTHGGFGGGMYKVFDLKSHGTIESIDNALFDFITAFFEKLR